ncbi:MAG: signal peptide peptidase SppA [Methanolinea sp.]|nr:signal peptide peptidase SppA [Methanolinea sp.]
MEENREHKDPSSRRHAFVLGIIIVLLVAGGAAAWFFLSSHSRDMGISVIRLEGVLVTGEGAGGGYTGSESIGRALRDAAEDPFVDAIVLRVNSPGGTPAAAQEIIRDIAYAKQRKPVVVSMGDIATSAAYYISASANRIYANPDTITGGIGTSWTFIDISEWLRERNISIEIIASGSRKDMGSGLRPLTPEEREYAQKIVNESNERFLADILAARSINRSIVADARVMRGQDALDAGLVDELGNLNDAIEGARRLASGGSP